MKSAKDIADELVRVIDYHGKVWEVEFGSGVGKYTLSYDTRSVAENIAGHLKALVEDALLMAVNEERSG